ncbi:Arylsulfotransferase-domain-containing protein [Xylaria arbuscula]|nr:Arylsulfotransferase-domain-containing protein [Xylaria arbuscula]
MLKQCALLLSTSLLTWHAWCDEIVTDYEGYNKAEYGILPRLNFKSIDTDAPMLQVTTWNRELVSKRGSHIFIRHDGNHGTSQDAAPLILSAEDLSVVYINRKFDAVFDVRAQRNGNQSYLTFYGGPMTEVGLGNGYAHAYDEHYNEVYRIAPQNLSVKGDLHECQFTGNGTALVTAYEPKPWNLVAYGGWSNGRIVDSVFQEVDLETNEVLFEWHASKHIDMKNSYENIKPKWDFFHLNSIEKTREGNYLLSARHTHAIYLINGTTGAVIWTLGGKSNDFTELPPYSNNSTRPFSNPVLSMSWQHHARFYCGNENEITLFDNHVLDYNGVNCERECSRGIHFRINATSEPRTVRLLNEYLHPNGMLSQSQGSVEVLDDGNVFVGWGRNPSFTEHTPDGETVLSVQFSPWRSVATADQGLDNYRAFRMDWKATPYWPPDIKVIRGGGNGTDIAYVSWNGATEVKYWVLLASDSAWDLDGAEKVVARLPRAGFETVLPVGPVRYQYVRAVALDANQTVIGTTDICSTDTGNFTVANYTITDLGILVSNDIADTYATSVSYAIGWGVLLGAVLFIPLSLGCAYVLRSPWFQGLCDEKLRALWWTWKANVVFVIGQWRKPFMSESRKEKKLWRAGAVWTILRTSDVEFVLEDGDSSDEDVI